MKLITFKNIALCAPLVIAFMGCTEDDYKLYDTTQKDSVFFEYRNANDELVDEVSYNFGYDIATVYTVDIPVTLMGVPKDHDRTINVVPVAEGTTMTEGVNYTITGNTIPANAVSGTVHVNLLRDKDPGIRQEEKTLVLTIAENDDLKSVGENSMTITYSDFRVEVRPDWWTTYSCLPVYSFENAQLFFHYFYDKAPKADISIFNEMIEKYGEYFVKASKMQGPMAMYEPFLRNYVLIPMYNENPDISWQKSPLF